MGSPSLPYSGLRQWGDIELRTRLSGGHRNDVFLADLQQRQVVVRSSPHAMGAGTLPV